MTDPATETCREANASLLRLEWLVAILFGVALTLAVGGLGSVVRPLFPVASVILAAWLLANRRPEDFVGLTLWLFFLTPGLRRFVDFRAGWSQVNVLMLAPYVVGALSALPVLKRLLVRRFAYSAPFAVVFACLIYGLVLAAFADRSFAAIFDVLRWGVPPCFGLFLALDPERYGAYRNIVMRTVLLGLIALSSYGVLQFLVVPPWDRLWMLQSGMDSIGFPEPYLVRVFSTMNSPGSLSNYLMAGLLLIMPARGVLRLPAIGLGAIALLLSLVRSSWLGLLIGFAFLLLLGASARARFSVLLGLVCLPLIVWSLYQIPQAAAVIDTRLNTFSGVQGDVSFNDRSAGYREFFYHDLPQVPFGVGLGANSFFQSYMDKHTAKYSDGALIEIGTDLGVFVGGAYLLAIFAVAIAGCWASVRTRDTFLSSCGAVIAAQIFGLSSGPTTVGEIGLLFWLAVGFCLAQRAASQRQPERPQDTMLRSMPSRRPPLMAERPCKAAGMPSLNNF